MSTINNQAAAFKALVDWLREALHEPEQFTLGYAAESSAFVRFNHGKVRQAGQVQQANVSFKLIDDGRHADLQITLSGDTETDLQRLAEGLQQLRETLPLLPPDPYLLLNPDHWQSNNVQDHPLPDTDQAVAEITGAADGLDLVGFYAAGPISRGFASSSGALGWHQANSFNFDFSLFHENGQAVKASYAGHEWSSEGFARRFEQAREQLAFLGRPLRTLPPGEYRAYLAPAAMEEIMGMLSWGGFSARAIASKQSPLQKFYANEASLSPDVWLSEQVSGSLSPAFSDEGYPRDDLGLIVKGLAGAQLINSRSAAEHGLNANGASSYEYPTALVMNEGQLEQQDILEHLGTGLYISNLWYLNYSDQPAARLTGMTRFATFWVENGQIVAPVSTMRFDDSVYSLLGSQLEGLSRERELLLSASTYSQRATASMLLPGALVKRLTLTL
ncbi:metallopeptidase TldD-related protein [Pseudomonas fluorescens]|uniref:TldD/PmbA family protein n=1 Tax=Pseudomonas fluorescens TaxID=294 RepID=A0A944HCE6_PSEFL|nr:metallopeptidase TldD-related protein [Pseudomonas fluorescens]MBT2297160.1 TldD/PmbA family protein [Pseudomonas fluorescens]MBT2306360.1 TldD/PmbA family protein [Pseudomonas fluorescens]MBT2310762.1 TldD/PmbA family protein [Pseudomonas fluorescens]MBT2318938.1 TldD/PmbA family protein [Pseudomonas fluorescens]MBT2328302.1 TldD/PmbA family protein [Pseudomonas fluorescens]